MSARRLLGIGRDSAGNVLPVFAAPDRVADALDHHRAVVGATRSGGFLPARLDMPVFEPMSLAARIAARRSMIVAALDAAADMVEIGVRISPVPRIAKAGPCLDGRSFLAQAAKRLSAAGAALEAVEERLSRVPLLGGVVAHRHIPDDRGTSVLALKVRRADAPALALAVEALASDDVVIEVSGPWPLYNFGAAEVLAEGSST
jgi:hypothetical protein